MRNTFRILFYLKRNAPLKNGRVPIMARVTLNGQRVQLSTHLSVNQETWCAATGQVTGRGRCADKSTVSLPTSVSGSNNATGPCF